MVFLVFSGMSNARRDLGHTIPILPILIMCDEWSYRMGNHTTISSNYTRASFWRRVLALEDGWILRQRSTLRANTMTIIVWLSSLREPRPRMRRWSHWCFNNRLRASPHQAITSNKDRCCMVSICPLNILRVITVPTVTVHYRCHNDNINWCR